MRYKLVHIFGLILIIGIALVAFDHYSLSTAVVIFSNAKPEIHRNQEPVAYKVDFAVRDDKILIFGTAIDSFGYNRLFESIISKSNLSQLNGRKIQIKYRKHQLLWLPATRVEDTMNLHFDPVKIWIDRT